MDDEGIAAGPDGAEPVVSCGFRGGTLSVYEDRVVFERSSGSMFEDKTVPMAEVSDVEFSSGILSGYIQVVQSGVDPDDGGLFSHPIDENTFHFPRGKEDCARRARDALLERAGG